MSQNFAMKIECQINLHTKLQNGHAGFSRVNNGSRVKVKNAEKRHK